MIQQKVIFTIFLKSRFHGYDYSSILVTHAEIQSKKPRVKKGTKIKF